MDEDVWFPYAKPTRRVHESGWRMFEVGYCTIGKNKRTDKIIQLGGCDHIFTDYIDVLNRPFPVNMDITKDGHIRFFGGEPNLKWRWDDFSVSDMSLIQGQYKPKENI